MQNQKTKQNQENPQPTKLWWDRFIYGYKFYAVTFTRSIFWCFICVVVYLRLWSSNVIMWALPSLQLEQEALRRIVKTISLKKFCESYYNSYRYISEKLHCQSQIKLCALLTFLLYQQLLLQYQKVQEKKNGPITEIIIFLFFHTLDLDMFLEKQ